LAYKKPKKTPTEPVTTDDFCRLTHQIKAVEQDLEAENEKARAIERKIDALEVKKKILLDSLKAREETTGDRSGTTVAAQDYVKALERKLETKELTIAILANVIRLSGLRSEGIKDDGIQRLSQTQG